MLSIYVLTQIIAIENIQSILQVFTQPFLIYYVNKYKVIETYFTSPKTHPQKYI